MRAVSKKMAEERLAEGMTNGELLSEFELAISTTHRWNEAEEYTAVPVYREELRRRLDT